MNSHNDTDTLQAEHALSRLSHLIKIDDHTLVTLDRQITLERVKILEGRGQAGLAAFYKDVSSNKEYLIKEDEIEVCLMEGSAGFAKKNIPLGFETCVNFAISGTLQAEHENKSISIQDKLCKSIPWDVMIYGKKRNPKTLISQELKNQEKIQENINNMSNEVQMQLAIAIYISTLVGDESLHTGQFMVELNQDHEIQKITRIDLGARERFALERSECEDFCHTTSKSYCRFGQFGKDYVAYLLKNPDVYAKYLQLWLHTKNIDELICEVGSEFDKQFEKIPQEKNQEAKEKVCSLLSKRSLTEKWLKKNDLLNLTTILESILASRLALMLENTKEELKTQLQILEVMHVNDDLKKKIIELVLEGKYHPCMIDDMIKQISREIQNNSNQLLGFSIILSHTIAALECLLLFSKYEDNKTFTQDVEKLQCFKLKVNVLVELNNYHDHLINSTKSTQFFNLFKRFFDQEPMTCLNKKISYVMEKIEELKNNIARVDLKDILDDYLFSTISYRRIENKTSDGEKIMISLLRLLHKYETSHSICSQTVQTGLNKELRG